MLGVCVLLGLVQCATFNAKVSPVQKVVELLDELKGKVEADLAAEEQLMQEYNDFCDHESNAREDAITAAKRTISDLSATIQDSSASAAALTGEVDDLAADISSHDADLAAATKVRTQERSDFETKEKELSETVDTLDRATIVLKRGQTFLQKGKGSEAMTMLAKGLSAIVSASWVSSADKAAVQGLLQADDEDLSMTPQATAAAYESKGGNIISVLEDMRSKAEQALSAARKAEMEQAHAFAMLKQDLETSLATMDKRKHAATIERTAANEAQSTATGDKSETAQGLASDKSYLAELKQSCATKDEEWAQRQKSAAEEMSAIGKAKEILQRVKSFFQTTARRVRIAHDDSSLRDHATSILRKLAKSGHSFALTQVIESAESDPFGKVRSLVESLVDRLLKEAGEEADAKQFCDSEMSKSKAKQDDLTADVDRHAVRIEKAAAGQAKLGQEARTLGKEISELDSAVAAATKIRQEENTEYQRASAEYKASAEAIAQAMDALQEYYAQGAFLQTSATAKQPDFGGAKTDVASTILSMLEASEADFTKLLAEAEASEQQSASAFAKLQQDSRATKAAKQEQVKAKESEVKSLELNMLNYKEDHATASKELDAVLKYLDELKPNCETKVMSYAERKQRREDEISGLKEALAILEG